MKKFFVILILLAANSVAALAVAPTFKRYVKKTMGMTIVVDVMFIDRDGDGCYDWTIIWVDGSFFADGGLLKAGGSGPGLSSDMVEEYAMETLDISQCQSANGNNVTFTLTEPNTAAAITVSKHCGEPDFVWTVATLPKHGFVSSNHFELSRPRISAYPNPVVGGELMVSVNEPCKMIGADVIDVDGKSTVLQSDSYGDQSINKFNVSSLTPGVYVLRLQTAECGVISTQVVVSSQGGLR